MKIFSYKQNIYNKEQVKAEKNKMQKEQNAFLNSIKVETKVVKEKNTILAQRLMNSTIDIEKLSNEEVSCMIDYFKEYIKTLKRQLK